MGGWSQLCDNFIGDLKNDLDCVHHLELHNLLHRTCISQNIWIEKMPILSEKVLLEILR